MLRAMSNRRDFLKTTAAAGLLALTPRAARAKSQISVRNPTLHKAGPVVIASENGHQFKNKGPRTCVEEAFRRLTKGGEDPLDAVIAGVNIVELDPLEDGVGYGGLPNANGVVQLDSSMMHGPTMRAGGVACLEGVRTPSLVAKAVLELTDHHLLVGKDAQTFARQMGMTIEDDLNTPNSRKLWLEWRRRTDPDHFPLPPGAPAKDKQARADHARETMVADGLLRKAHAWGTIHCGARSPKGDLAAVTTTSGLPWKIPGRVGDSPILGAGIYVHQDHGTAGSTGRGEANLYNLSSFFIVEQLRAGKHPKDAGLEALKRVAESTPARLRDDKGRPKFFLQFYVIDKVGRYAGVTMWDDPDNRFAVCTENGAELQRCEPLYSKA